MAASEFQHAIVQELSTDEVVGFKIMPGDGLDIRAVIREARELAKSIGGGDVPDAKAERFLKLTEWADE